MAEIFTPPIQQKIEEEKRSMENLEKFKQDVKQELSKTPAPEPFSEQIRKQIGGPVGEFIGGFVGSFESIIRPDVPNIYVAPFSQEVRQALASSPAYTAGQVLGEALTWIGPGLVTKAIKGIEALKGITTMEKALAIPKSVEFTKLIEPGEKTVTTITKIDVVSDLVRTGEKVKVATEGAAVIGEDASKFVAFAEKSPKGDAFAILTKTDDTTKAVLGLDKVEQKVYQLTDKLEDVFAKVEDVNKTIIGKVDTKNQLVSKTVFIEERPIKNIEDIAKELSPKRIEPSEIKPFDIKPSEVNKLTDVKTLDKLTEVKPSSVENISKDLKTVLEPGKETKSIGFEEDVMKNLMKPREVLVPENLAKDILSKTLAINLPKVIVDIKGLEKVTPKEETKDIVKDFVKDFAGEKGESKQETTPIPPVPPVIPTPPVEDIEEKDIVTPIIPTPPVEDIRPIVTPIIKPTVVPEIEVKSALNAIQAVAPKTITETKFELSEKFAKGFSLPDFSFLKIKFAPKAFAPTKYYERRYFELKNPFSLELVPKSLRRFLE
jgi:hypothetical protein